MKLVLKTKIAAIDAAAHEAATSPRNDRPEPSPAQKEAGNYKVGRLRWKGMELCVENPKGSVRSGTGADGTTWRTVLQHHYGYVRAVDGRAAAAGADDDKVDVFLGDNPESEAVFVIDQVNREGTFDEHKVVLCASSEGAARAIYLANYAAGWKGLGAITALTLAEFKTWLVNHDTRQPMAWNRRPAAEVFRKALTAWGRVVEWFRPRPRTAARERPAPQPLRLVISNGRLLLKAPVRGHRRLDPRTGQTVQVVGYERSRQERTFHEDLAKRWRELEHMRPVRIEPGALAAIEDLRELRTAAEVAYRALPAAITRDGREVRFVNRSFGKLRSESANRRTMEVVPALPELIQNAVLLSSDADREPEKYPNITQWHTYAARARYGGDDAYVRLTTWEEHGREYLSFYDTRVVTGPEMRQALRRQPDSVSNQGEGSAGPVDKEILIAMARRVKADRR